jgi:hypothetical protein
VIRFGQSKWIKPLPSSSAGRAPAAFGTTSFRTAAAAAPASAAFTATTATAARALAAATASATAFTAASATASALVHFIIYFIRSSGSFICHNDFSYRMVRPTIGPRAASYDKILPPIFLFAQPWLSFANLLPHLLLS